MVAPVPTAEVLLISRHPRRSLDLRRLGMEVRQEDPSTLDGAPALGAVGVVIIDALDGDSAAADLLATVGPHVESAAVVVLLDESTPAPDSLGAQMRILRSPIRGQDVAATILELTQATGTAEPETVIEPEVAPVVQPAADPAPEQVAPAPASAPLQKAPSALAPAAQAPAPAVAPTPAPAPTQEARPPEHAPATAQEAPPSREWRFGRRRHSATDAVEPAQSAQSPPALDWSAHAAAVLAGLHARPTWKEVAGAVVAEAAPALGPCAALLVREPDGTWPVAAGEGLRQLEYGLIVEDDHTLVGLGTKQHPVAVVPDTDALRSDLIGAPLASRRSLLVALVFPLPVLLVVGRTEGSFDKVDVRTAVGFVERWRWPLAAALQRRDLARSLQRFS